MSRKAFKQKFNQAFIEELENSQKEVAKSSAIKTQKSKNGKIKLFAKLRKNKRDVDSGQKFLTHIKEKLEQESSFKKEEADKAKVPNHSAQPESKPQNFKKFNFYDKNKVNKTTTEAKPIHTGITQKSKINKQGFTKKPKQTSKISKDGKVEKKSTLASKFVWAAFIISIAFFTITGGLYFMQTAEDENTFFEACQDELSFAKTNSFEIGNFDCQKSEGLNLITNPSLAQKKYDELVDKNNKFEMELSMQIQEIDLEIKLLQENLKIFETVLPDEPKFDSLLTELSVKQSYLSDLQDLEQTEITNLEKQLLMWENVAFSANLENSSDLQTRITELLNSDTDQKIAARSEIIDTLAKMEQEFLQDNIFEDWENLNKFRYFEPSKLADFKALDSFAEQKVGVENLDNLQEFLENQIAWSTQLEVLEEPELTDDLRTDFLLADFSPEELQNRLIRLDLTDLSDIQKTDVQRFLTEQNSIKLKQNGFVILFNQIDSEDTFEVAYLFYLGDLLQI